MSTSTIALGIATTLVVGLVFGLGVLSLLFGVFEWIFGRPKLVFLKPNEFEAGFAFTFKWNAAKEPAKIDNIELRLFNPLGNPSQVQIKKSFDPESESFSKEIDFGKRYIDLLGAEGFESGRVEVIFSSTADGVNFAFEYPASKFKALLSAAGETLADLDNSEAEITWDAQSAIPARSFIADTVPGKGAQLAIPTNPAFEAYFKNMGGGGAAEGGADAPAQENFNIEKVWIEPGCIVCNACEDIYPEVFEVLADTCIIRPNPPLDDGLRMEEAADACPVEVIKFTKATA